MFIIADIEWITNDEGRSFPAQLAAIKADKNWEQTDTFSSYINLSEYKIYDYDHMAYTGATREEILQSKTIDEVFEEFNDWIDPDDVIIWWHKDSNEIFREWNTESKNKSIIIKRLLLNVIKQPENTTTNLYKLSEQSGIDTKPELAHCSANDARVMLDLIKIWKYSPKKIEKFLAKSAMSNLALSIEPLPYRYDRSTNTIHKKDCALLADIEYELEGRSKLLKAVSKGYKLCDCCKKEYLSALKNHNLKVVKKMNLPYVYTPNSKVFHKSTCSTILSSKDIRGTTRYDKLISSGKIPCKRCNPSPEDSFDISRKKEKKGHKNLPKDAVKALRKRNIADNERKRLLKRNKELLKAVERLNLAMEERERKQHLTKEEAEKEYAFKRHNAAQKAMNDALLEKALSKSDLRDLYVRTDPYYSFWVSKGYETFHSYGCPKLQSLKNLRGFRTYEEAVAAGFKPCKKCKPSAKNNQKYSIPIKTKVRANEKIEDIEERCKKEGYSFNSDSNYIFIETPIGKWKIKTDAFPIKVDHINLSGKFPEEKEYHDQHCRFLSFADVFSYIKKHDDALSKRIQGCKAQIMCFDTEEI